MVAFTTMITPYKADGSLDLYTAERYVDWYYENRLDGIFAVCQSSEIFHLSLEERVMLNRCVYKRAKQLDSRLKVVSSGHISQDPRAQAKELNAIYRSGTDVLILITNRLDPENQGDDVFIENAERLIAALPSEAMLGLYECPYPYKRLVTPKILNWCLSTGRFRYIKDTCCNTELMAERSRLLASSDFKLLNANCQTLLESMQNGADGYCGIMCNFHPRLYAWLVKGFKAPNAEAVQALLGSLGFTEGGLPYPLTAKYHMGLCGIPTEIISRNCRTDRLDSYAKSCIRQMKLITDYAEKALNL